ncbi:hypothetical protein HDE_13468 [Halotydeus destructor]|nr:hypothetical protein HDE_13468 [Halotydeus destructor]
MKLLLIVIFICLVNSLNYVTAEANCNGSIVFHKYKFVAPAIEQFELSDVLYEEVNQAITGECLRYCRESSRCRTFTMDYSGNKCQAFLDPVNGSHDKLVQSSETNLFEKLCYETMSDDEVDTVCGRDRLWTMDISIGSSLEGFAALKIENTSRHLCAQSCVSEKSFLCRSANYDSESSTCTLSKESQWTQRQAWRENQSINMTYFENQCIPAETTACLYETIGTSTVSSPDLITYTDNEAHCSQQCNEQLKFNCKSYSWSFMKCSLSGDDCRKDTNETQSVFGSKNCFYQCTGLSTYERMSGFDLDGSKGTAIGSNLTVEECANECSKDFLKCTAFLVDMLGQCSKLDMNSQGRSKSFKRNESLVYFEKVCLDLPEDTVQTCSSKSWTFERSLGQSLAESDYEAKFDSVTSRIDCETRCLREKQFQCRSAVYDEQKMTCMLSSKWKSNSQLITTGSAMTSYLENQCLPQSSSCDFVEVSEGSLNNPIDSSLAAQTVGECKGICISSSSFSCNAFSYSQEEKRCLLSSLSALKSRSATTEGNFITYEKVCTGTPVDNTVLESTTSETFATTLPPDTTVALTETPVIAETEAPVTEPIVSTATPEIVTTGSATVKIRTTKTEATELPITVATDPVTMAATEATTLPLTTETILQPVTEAETLPPTTVETLQTTTELVTPPPTTIETIQTTTEAATVPPTTIEIIQTTTESITLPPTTVKTVDTTVEATTVPPTTVEILETTTEPTTIKPTTIETTLPPTEPPVTETPTTVPITIPPEPETTTEIPITIIPISIKAESDPVTPSSFETTTTIASTPTPSGSSSSPESRCSANEEFQFERITGFEPITGEHLTAIYAGESWDLGILEQCMLKCREQSDCKGFVLDYSRRICFAVTKVQGGLRISNSKDYFEGLCVRKERSCGRLWTWEKIVDQLPLSAPPRMELMLVSQKQCRQYCMSERRFRCTSFSHDEMRQLCRMYSVDRHSEPFHLTFAPGNVFVENMCAFRMLQCRYLPFEKDTTILTIVKSFEIYTYAECQKSCDFERAFTCRSFTFIDRNYLNPTNLCLLSSDNKQTSRAGLMRFFSRSFYSSKICRPMYR